MTITFYSNFLNHHQLPLCQEFIKLIGEDNFHFVSCEKIHEERTKMGYEDMNVKYPFVVRAYESDEQMRNAIRLAHESDVAIIGTTNKIVSDIRAEENKLTFLFQERLFKNGSWHRFIPTTALSIYNSSIKYRRKNFYILCASAYSASDYSLCGFPRKKCLKWGYFPELLPKSDKSFDKLHIMWCGRMIWWKHPEHAVEVARILKEKGIPFEMQMIGNGDKRQTVEKLIKKYDLSNNILLHDFMSPADIRKTMNNANIYLFTSGKQEGWGVVLNEAMNSSCVVVANDKAGSTPYLMEDNINGFLYDGTIESLSRAIDKLLESSHITISENAYSTISQVWCPQNASQSLIEFVKSNHTPLSSGPCSLA